LPSIRQAEPFSVVRVPATIDELLSIATAHATAEALDDPAPVLATLEDDCVYELQPLGVVLEGMDLARRYYDHFFSAFRPLVAGYEMRGEWHDERGLGQEYTIWTRTGPNGGLERHEVIGILTFGPDKLSGERVYGSDRLLRLMFGPVLDEGRPIEVGAPAS
jgi:hypothetical protein